MQLRSALICLRSPVSPAPWSSYFGTATSSVHPVYSMLTAASWSRSVSPPWQHTQRLLSASPIIQTHAPTPEPSPPNTGLQSAYVQRIGTGVRARARVCVGGWVGGWVFPGPTCGSGTVAAHRLHCKRPRAEDSTVGVVKLEIQTLARCQFIFLLANEAAFGSEKIDFSSILAQGNRWKHQHLARNMSVADKECAEI